ncbi:MAG TPA: hypothetical protein VMJ10_14375 [Kofleriaceae bacterium]|nr:hypothetical protein [Kofleriaceae bacterium]
MPSAAVLVIIAALGCSSKAQQNAPPPEPSPEKPIDVPGGKSPSVQPARSDDPRLHLNPDEGTLTIEKAEAKAGSVATANVTVQPASGYHVNKEYPTKMTLEAPPGVRLSKPVLDGADAATFTEQSLIFEVKATADKPGVYEVKGTFLFAVCSKDSCHEKKQPISIQVAAD